MVDELVGRQFGNYSLRRLLGRGSFADVYLGEHQYLQTLAAIKILRLHLLEEARDSFLHEAQTVARLEHAHIVRVLEFGVEQQRPFLVMNYAHHGTLRERFRRGIAFSPATIVPYVTQLAQALDYAHSRNVIHRDIKPENIVLTSEQELLLSDFGLATVAQERTADFAGTLLYMSPEQIQGKVCAASDQYASGVMVYEWITGRTLFRGTQFEIVQQHLSAPPVFMDGDVSPGIEAVVQRTLMKAPEDRFPSMSAFARAFARAAGAPPASLSITVPMAAVKGSFNSASVFREENGVALPPGEETLADAPSRIFSERDAAPPLSLLSTAPKGAPLLEKAADVPVQHGAPIEKAPRHTRRALLLGVTGLLAAGALGAGLLALVEHQRSASSLASAQQQSTQRSAPHLTPAPRRASSPSQQATPPASFTPAATPGLTGTPTPATSSTPLRLQLLQYPATLVNGQTATIDVLANEPDVPVMLHVAYNVPPSKTVTVSQQADSQGHATLSWTVSVSPGKKKSSPLATLLISATDAQGKSTSIPLSLPVLR